MIQVNQLSDGLWQIVQFFPEDAGQMVWYLKDTDARELWGKLGAELEQATPDPEDRPEE